MRSLDEGDFFGFITDDVANSATVTTETVTSPKKRMQPDFEDPPITAKKRKITVQVDQFNLTGTAGVAMAEYVLYDLYNLNKSEYVGRIKTGVSIMLEVC